MESLIKTISTSFDLRIHKISASLGAKPNKLTTEYDAPTIWGDLGNVATAVDTTLPDNIHLKIEGVSRGCDHLLGKYELILVLISNTMLNH